MTQGNGKSAAEPFTSRSRVQTRSRSAVTEKPSSSAADSDELFPAKQAHTIPFCSQLGWISLLMSSGTSPALAQQLQAQHQRTVCCSLPHSAPGGLVPGLVRAASPERLTPAAEQSAATRRGSSCHCHQSRGIRIRCSGGAGLNVAAKPFLPCRASMILSLDIPLVPSLSKRKLTPASSAPPATARAFVCSRREL